MGPFTCIGSSLHSLLADRTGGPLVAKSFDWSTGDGWLVLNERGRERSLLFAGPSSAPWQARYASLSLTTLAPGLPVSGMNEAGLVIESLVDFGAASQSKIKPGVPTALEFVQMGLDTAESVDELIDLAERNQFVQLAVALHFLACDRSGTCAVIESHAGEVHVTQGLALKTNSLANQPYSEDVQALEASWLPTWLRYRKGSSEARFSLAAAAARSRPKHATELLSELEQVRMPGLTQWQLVWEPGEGRLNLRLPQRETAVRTFSVHDVPACQPEIQVLALSDSSARPRAWSTADASLVKRLVRVQLGDSDEVSFLAGLIAKHARSTSCPVAR